MTHFIGAVVVPAHIPTSYRTEVRLPGQFQYEAFVPNADLTKYLDYALMGFDENHDVPRFLQFTKAQLIANERKRIADYAENPYAEYISDPAAYALKTSHAEHLEYLKTEFPKKITWSDEECYAEAIRFEEPENIDADGAVWTTVNPEGHWDWWQIGGRWQQEYAERQGETITAFLENLSQTVEALESGVQLRPEPEDGRDMEDPDRKLPWWFPANLVFPEGESFHWTEQNAVGWFGTRGDGLSELEWIAHLVEVASALPADSKVVYIDFHV